MTKQVKSILAPTGLAVLALLLGAGCSTTGEIGNGGGGDGRSAGR